MSDHDDDSVSRRAAITGVGVGLLTSTLGKTAAADAKPPAVAPLPDPRTRHPKPPFTDGNASYATGQIYGSSGGAGQP